MSRLDAVNQILLAAGEAIVADLANQSGVDTSMAEYILDQYTDDLQLRGLANNQYPKTLQVDSVTKRVYLPQTLISLDFYTVLFTEDGHQIRVSVQNDGVPYLWNVTEQTDIWTAYEDNELKALLTVRVDWEDMDTPMQRAVVASAARRYQMLVQGDGEMDAYLAADESIYGYIGKSRDIESKGRTIFGNQSPVQRRSVFRQNSTVVNPNFRYWRGRTS
jgi:hypothetical protein